MSSPEPRLKHFRNAGDSLVPVALFAFNRADTTARVFEAIRRARPQTLFLVCDGPRPDRPGECDAVRSILEGVDWPCDVRRDYASENIGCRRRMISGISWVFSQTPEAILLEDDCLPSPSFFRFASEMLTRFRDDHRVMMVQGGNLVFNQLNNRYSYTFGRSTGIWGWATWARAWAHYDEHLTRWPLLRETCWLSELLENKRQVDFWRKIFDLVHSGMEDTWDYQWTFSTWVHDGLSVIPSRNLVRNIGYKAGSNSGATEEIPWIRDVVAVPLCEMEFPLQHPPHVQPNQEFDAAHFNFAWGRIFPPPRATQAWQHLRNGEIGTLARKAARFLWVRAHPHFTLRFSSRSGRSAGTASRSNH
jgi:hypothetical protein